MTATGAEGTPVLPAVDDVRGPEGLDPDGTKARQRADLRAAAEAEIAELTAGLPRRGLAGRVLLPDGGRLPDGFRLVAGPRLPDPRLASGASDLRENRTAEIESFQELAPEDAELAALFPDEPSVRAARGRSGVPAPPEAGTVEASSTDSPDAPARRRAFLLGIARARFEHRQVELEVSSDGRFTRDDLPRSPFRITCEDELLYVEPAVRVEAGDEDLRLDVVLRRGATVDVSVVTPEGRPPTGATDLGFETSFDPWAMASGSLSMVQYDTATLSADGTHRFLRVPPGRSMVLSVRPADTRFQPARTDVLPLQPGERRAVFVLLRPGNRLAVRVEDTDGHPLPDVDLALRRVDLSLASMSMDQNAETNHGGKTDANGRAAFEGLPDGRFRFLLRDPRYRIVKSPVVALGTGPAPGEQLLVADPGLSISGRLLDEDGTPLAGGDVRAVRKGSMLDMAAAMERADRAPVEADEQGRFTIVGLDPGPYTLSARAPGHVPDEVPAEAGASGLELRLAPRATLSGIVVSLGDGEPVTDFTLSVLPAGGLFNMSDLMSGDIEGRMERIVSQRGFHGREDGTFVLDGIIPGTYDLELDAKGFGQARVESLEVGPTGRKGVVVMLPPEARITGVVVDARTGAPIAGAVVQLGGDQMAERMTAMMTGTERNTTTDADGRFRLGGLGAGTLRFSVRHPDFRTLLPAPIVLGPGEEHDLGTLALSKGASIRGHVFDTTGAPVAGLGVLCADATGRSAKRVVSDERGEYLVEGLGAGTYTVMRLDFKLDLGGDAGPMDFLKDASFEQVTLAEDELKVVDLRVASREGTTLSGTVRDSAGPVPGAMVTAIPGAGGFSGMKFGSTGKDGRYEVTGLKPGDYDVQVAVLDSPAGGSVGGAPVSPWSRRITIAEGPEQRQDVTLPGGTLVGRVLGKPDDEPLDGARVVLERKDLEGITTRFLALTGGRVGETYTGPDGRFEFRHLAAGRYDVIAGGRNVMGFGKAGWSIERKTDVQVLEGGAGFTLTLRLAPSATVAGTVRDPSGQPVAGAGVWVLEPGGIPRSTFTEVTTGDDGRYVVDGLKDGTVGLAFRGGSWALSVVPSVTARVGEETPLDVTLVPGVRLQVQTDGVSAWELGATVSGPSGPVPTGLMSLGDLAGGLAGTSLLDLGVLPPGTYHVRVISNATGDVLLEQDVTLTAGSGPVVLGEKG